MYSNRILFSLPTAVAGNCRNIVRPSPFVLGKAGASWHAPLITRSYATVKGGARAGIKKEVKPKPKPTKTAEYPTSSSVPTQAPLHDSQPASSHYEESYAQQQQYDGRTAAEYVNESTSLQQFLKRSMGTTALAVGGAAASCALWMQIPLVVASPMACMIGGLVGSIGCLFGLTAIQPTYGVDQNGNLKAFNSPARQAVFAGLLAAQGLGLAPLMFKVAVIAPMAIPVAGALSVATMAGMAAYALKQPQGALQKWGPALYVGMFGMIGVGLVNMFVHSNTLSMITSGAGVLIFAGFTAYDTHVAIQEHAEGRPDHLLTAANFYMNFINLFLDYLRLISSWFSE
jgi:FtsH-binding integral membrane protein